MSMIAKNFKPEIRAGMMRQYFERYKALMHVANETEEELAKVAGLKKASSQYKKSTPAHCQSSVVISRFGFAFPPRARVKSKPIEAESERLPIHTIAGTSE